MDSLPEHSFTGLEPGIVLDALEMLGLYSDGRLLALNSYENRVYQVGMEQGPPLIVKFYRPRRWSDEAILEEHGFALELERNEIPVVPPLLFEGRTLHQYQGYRFAVFRRQGGRTPELDQPGVLEWIGRFMGRPHSCGRRARRVYRAGHTEHQQLWNSTARMAACSWRHSG
jgi:Ser/Thr protein kinase RdoA (MazF antagonist)